MKLLLRTRYLIALIALLCTNYLTAQVAGYNFSQSTSTYTPITGGTSHWSITSTTRPDDNVANSVAIGFGFVFGGTTFTTVGISNNGVISFSGTASTSYEGINGSDNNVIAPLGDDLSSGYRISCTRTTGSPTVTTTFSTAGVDVGDIVYGTGMPAGVTVVSKTANSFTLSANATSSGTGTLVFSGGGVRSQLLGTAPNRTFVIQYTDMSSFGTNSEALDFQVILYETTNVIQFVYGDCFYATIADDATVGLRGASAADFVSRTSASNFNTTTASTAIANIVAYGSTNTPPVSGLTFTWTPASCSPPSGLTPSAVTVSGATVSWTAASGATAYNWEVQPQGTPQGTPGAVASGTGLTATTVNVTGLSANTAYTFFIQSACGGPTSNYGSVSFTTPCNTFSSFPFNESFETTSTSVGCWSNSFVTGTFNWTYATGSNGVVTTAQQGTRNARFASQSGTNNPVTKFVSPVFDLTSLTAPQLKFWYAQPNWAGDQNTLGVYYRISPTDPWVLINDYTADVSAWTEVTIILPSPSATYQIAFEGRNNYGYANVIDNVTVEEAPSCLAPTGLFSLVLTTSDVGVGWNAVSGATQYIVEYREVGAGTWTSFAGNPVTTTNAGISGLNAANYEWQVMADCGAATSTFASSTFSTVPGYTCGLPFVANAFPFTHTTTTCGAGNDYGIQCSGLYGAGEDFVYQLDITTTGTYEITVSGPTTYTGWFLKDGSSCATPAACLANATSGSGTTATATYNFTVPGTYFLVVDHWPAPNCGAYTLTINPPTPAPGCSSNETATPNPSCSNQNLVFSWDAAPTATGYRISIGTTPGGTQIQNLLSVGNTLSYTFATPNINTTYYWTVTPFNLGGNATGCTEQSYTTGSVACHCIPAYTFGKTDGDLISNIAITGTTLSNNTGTAQVNPAYTYFTGQPNYTATLQAGTSYSVNVTVGTWGNQHIRAWIDYNDNGVFESTESIGSTVVAPGQANAGPFAPASFNITLSCSPPSGLHRMRVRTVWSTTAGFNTTIDPCATYGYGETEDYDVFITPAPACPAPFAMAASNVTFNSADLAWTAGCFETVWDVHVTTGAAPSGAANNPGLTATNLALSSLMPATTYNVYYRANCGPGSTSTWSSYSFTTLPAPPVNDDACGAIAFSRVETSRFGLGASTLTCSSILGSTTDATNDPVNGCGGTDSRAVWYQFTTPDCFTGGNLTGFNMKFSTRNAGTNYDSRIAIYASSDNTCNGTFTNLYCNDDSGVDGCVGSLSGLTSTIEATAGTTLEAGRTYWVRVSGFGAADAGNFELTISVEPNAPTLTNSTTNPTGVINASWTDVNAASYRLYWRPTGGSGYAIRTLSTTSFSTNAGAMLMPNTSYDFWVNNWCGATLATSFASPVATLSTAAPSAGCSVPVPVCGTSTPTTIMMNWPEVTGAVRIGVRYSFTGQAGYSQVSSLAYATTGGVSSFNFVGLQANMAYTFTFFVECDGRIFWSAPVTCSTGTALPRLAADVHSFEYDGTEFVDVRMTDFEYFAPAAGLPNHTVDVSTGKLLVTFDQEIASNEVRFTLTPNVTTDLSTLTIYTGKATDANINIFDMNGALVQTMSMGEVNNGQQVSLNTSKLAAGVYYVNLRTGNTTTTEKLVIVR